MKARPTARTEISVSFQHRDGHLACAYLTVVREHADGQRSCVLSRHVAATDERLVDLVQHELRELTLDYVLAGVEPF